VRFSDYQSAKTQKLCLQSVAGDKASGTLQYQALRRVADVSVDVKAMIRCAVLETKLMEDNKCKSMKFYQRTVLDAATG